VKASGFLLLIKELREDNSSLNRLYW